MAGKYLRSDQAIALIQESGAFARAFMDIRYRFFASFMIITGLLFTAYFRTQELEPLRWQVSVSGIVLTVLFWRLDWRTFTYHRGYIRRIAQLEKALNEYLPDPAPAPTRFGWFNSNAVTNALFAVAVLFWAQSWAGLGLLEPRRDPGASPAPAASPGPRGPDDRKQSPVDSKESGKERSRGGRTDQR